MIYREIKTAFFLFFAIILIAVPVQAEESKTSTAEGMQEEAQRAAENDKFFDQSWKHYFSKDALACSYDSNSVIKPADGFVSVWIQKMEQKKVKLEALTSINCSERQYSFLQITVLEGERVRAPLLNNPWTNISSFTAEDALHSVLCKGIAAAKNEKPAVAAEPVVKKISKRETQAYKAYGKEERDLIVPCSKKDMKSCRAYYNKFIKKSGVE
ncbi:MAG: hypothetical protein HQL10_03570 [Nitrospirae bacterium]|nr:hypothetical protein [Nitrospirota bacterium]